MDELSSLSLSDRFSDLALFILYGLLASLAGGTVMGIVDAIERLWLKGNVSKAQYGIALGVTFFIGLFIQWEQSTRELDRLKTQSPVSDLRASIATRDAQLAEKDRIIQDIRREKDLLGLRNEALEKDVDAKSQRIGQLENAKKDKARRQSIRSQLGRFIDEAGELDKELAVSEMGVRPDLLAKLTSWENNALNYISRELGEPEAAIFRMAEGAMRGHPPHVNSFRSEWDALWNRLWAKKLAIEKIIDRLV